MRRNLDRVSKCAGERAEVRGGSCFGRRHGGALRFRGTRGGFRAPELRGAPTLPGAVAAPDRSQAGFYNPYTTILAFDGATLAHSGEVMPAATATRWPAPVS